MRKKEVIDNLYLVFRKYNPSDMYYCDCGCIDVRDVKKLASKKLRDLEEDDFISYHGSALYTWGGLEHYKHFLPRILEVHNELNGEGMIGLCEITRKLEYAKWMDWNEFEIKAIKDFILIDWNEFVNERKSEIRKEDLEYYAFFTEFHNLMESWEITTDRNGLRNFVQFYYRDGSALMNTGLTNKGKNYRETIKLFIQQKNLVEHLENEFFSVESKDNEYAEKVSTVLQMIEQEIKVFNEQSC